MYYDSLIRNMSTIIFLIFSFLTKKEGKSEHFCSITSPCYFYGIFMVGAALCTAKSFIYLVEILSNLISKWQ